MTERLRNAADFEIERLTRERDEARELWRREETRMREAEWALDAAGVSATAPMPPGVAGCQTFSVAERIGTLAAQRDEARAEVERLRAEVEKLRALPSAEDLEERAHEILDGAGIPTHALDPVSGEEDYRADLEERLEWTVEEITRLRRALEPFARFGAAVLLVDGGSGKWHSIRVEGHEHTISREDFRRARAALAGEGEAKECWCQWEAGDSPCPTHGMDEEKGGRDA